MYTIVGLGNPEARYEKTRHNVGRMIVSRLHDVYGFPNWKRDTMREAHTSMGTFKGVEVRLAIPLTYMNHSGTAVSKLMRGASAEQLIVLHDELDLPVGSFKISFGRGSAGNRGVASIVKEVGTTSFIRVRIGVAPTTLWGKIKKRAGAGKDFVIAPFSKAEQTTLATCEEALFEALGDIVLHGKEHAMNTWNRKESGK